MDRITLSRCRQVQREREQQLTSRQELHDNNARHPHVRPLLPIARLLPVSRLPRETRSDCLLSHCISCPLIYITTTCHQTLHQHAG